MFKRYINELANVLHGLDLAAIEQVVGLLEAAHEKRSTIFIFGNGGSSATASHMCNDLGVGLKLRGIRNFNVESLGDNSAVCTAIANDIGYENTFYAQLANRLRTDDLVIAISCSGNSANITKAVLYAKKIGSKVIGLTGFDGGELKALSDVAIHVGTAKGEYGIVEDVHMIFNHMIYTYYISTKPETKTKYTLV